MNESVFRPGDIVCEYLASVLNISGVTKRFAGWEPKARMDAYEAVFTALAHPARRRILLTMNFEGGSMTAGEIADVFQHAWPTTTRHIQVLESAGLVYHERQGRVRVYHIRRSRLELVRDWLAWFLKDPR
jgi:DNA-binding transcriptional ArsR family regulator